MSLVRARIRMRGATAIFAVVFCLLAAPPGYAQKFYPDDPIQEDRDDLPIEKPGVIELSATYDVIENSFVNKVEGPIPRAVNVNTLGEVPDSSWFTNRIGVRSMSIEELVRGPNRVGGPDLSEPVTIISGKVGGITPGLVVRDRRDKVVAHYFTEISPLDSFRVVGSRLEFSNLGQQHGLATARAYEYEWFRFDNDTMKLTALAGPQGEVGEVGQPSLPIPVSDAPYLMVRIRTRSDAAPKWRQAVDIYLGGGDERTVVGIEREIEEVD